MQSSKISIDLGKTGSMEQKIMCNYHYMYFITEKFTKDKPPQHILLLQDSVNVI